MWLYTYHRSDLLAYLGDYARDFDIEAIEREATEVLPNGSRVWVVDGDDLIAICQRHDFGRE